MPIPSRNQRARVVAKNRNGRKSNKALKISKPKVPLETRIRLKTPIIIIIFCLFKSFGFGQTADCVCKNQNKTVAKPSKVFRLTQSKSIAVCGFTEIRNGKAEYSEFSLHQCGQSKIINEWDGTQTCTIIQNKDTLIVQELYAIPNEKRLSVKWREFYVTKYYFKKNKLIDTSYFRNDLKKYNSKEIQTALTNFNTIKDSVTNFDNYLFAIKQLFWAYVSGSKKAERHLLNLRKNYGKFDGGNSEEFDSLIMTFENYRDRQK